MKVPTPLNPQTAAPVNALGYRRNIDISAGTKALAGVISDYSKQLEDENKKKELFKVSQLIVEETNNLQQNFDDKTQIEPLGAPNFVQRVNGEYATRHDQMIANLRAQGFSDDAINEAETRLGTLRSQYVARAIDFQDKSSFAKTGADTEQLATSLSQYATNNPNAVGSALNELRVALQHSNLDEIEQEQMFEQHKAVILQGARQGYALQNSEAVIRMFDPQSLATASVGKIDTGTGSQPFDIATYIKKNHPAEGTAKNPDSSAIGYFQFINNTWKENYREAFPNSGETDAQILAKRKDLPTAERVMEHFTGKNIARLQAAGKPINDTTVYLAHFLGVDDAIKVLNAHTDVTVASLVSPSSIRSNKEVFRRAITVGQLLNWASKKMGVEQQADGTFTEQPAPLKPIPVGWKGNQEDAIQELGMTADQAKIYLETGRDTRVPGQPNTGGVGPTPAVAVTETPTLVPETVPIGPDGKTGIPIIDLSSGPERMQMLAWAKGFNAENNAVFKATVDVTHQNAVNAYMATGTYTGNKPTEADYIKAYGPVIGPQKLAELNNAAAVGTHIQQFKTQSNTEIDQSLEALRPKNTASPTYTEELQAYNNAVQAADHIKQARKENPSGYLYATFPGLSDKLASAKTPEERKAAYTAINEAYKQLGIPQGERYILTKEQAAQLQQEYENLGPDQKVARLEQWYTELGDLRQPLMRQLTRDGYGAGSDIMLWIYLRNHPNDYAIMSQVLQGKNIIKEDPSRKPSPDTINIHFKDTIGTALSSLNPTAANIFNEAAAAIYVANGGRTDSQLFDPDLYEDSLRKAVGGLPGDSESGIVDMRQGAVKDFTILPQGENRQSFRRWIDRLQPNQLTRMSVEGLRPVYSSGRPVPTQDMINEGVFVAIAPNKYIIKMASDGNPLKTETGNYYIVQIVPSNNPRATAVLPTRPARSVTVKLPPVRPVGK